MIVATPADTQAALPLADTPQHSDEAELRDAYRRSRLRDRGMSYAQAVAHPLIGRALRNVVHARRARKPAR